VEVVPCKKTSNSRYAIMRLTTVGKNRYEKKGIKGSFMPPLTAIKRFCGFPMGLTTLPVVTANASARSIIFGGRLCLFASASMTGVPNDCKRVIHQKSRCKACAEEDIEDKGINAPNPSESLIRQMGEIT